MIGKSTIDGPFSIAMLNYQRVTNEIMSLTKTNVNHHAVTIENIDNSMNINSPWCHIDINHNYPSVLKHVVLENLDFSSIILPARNLHL